MQEPTVPRVPIVLFDNVRHVQHTEECVSPLSDSVVCGAGKTITGKIYGSFPESTGKEADQATKATGQ